MSLPPEIDPAAAFPPDIAAVVRILAGVRARLASGGVASTGQAEDASPAPVGAQVDLRSTGPRPLREAS